MIVFRELAAVSQTVACHVYSSAQIDARTRADIHSLVIDSQIECCIQSRDRRAGLREFENN